MSSLTPRIDRMEKNYIINGDMRIAQRGASFAAAASGAYTLDRWAHVRATTTAVATISQDTDVPTLAQANYLFQNSMRVNITTADATITAGENFRIVNRVEGYNWTQLAQKAFTLSFWVKSSVTGTYCVAFSSSTDDRYYIAEYVVNAASTWEFKTINVLASPSSGTWNYTNGIGLCISFWLANGNTTGTAGSWLTSPGAVVSTQVNAVATNGNDWRITGVMISEGTSTGTSFRTFAQSYQQELGACQRYFQTVSNGLNGQVISSVQMNMGCMWPVRMRNTPVASWATAPTIVAPGRATYTAGSTAFLTNAASSSGIYIEMNNFSGMTTNDELYWYSGGVLNVDAEL